MSETFERLAKEAADQLSSEGQITLVLYADIEEAGFSVNSVIDAADKLNAN